MHGCPCTTSHYAVRKRHAIPCNYAYVVAQQQLAPQGKEEVSEELVKFDDEGSDEVEEDDEDNEVHVSQEQTADMLRSYGCSHGLCVSDGELSKCGCCTYGTFKL